MLQDGNLAVGAGEERVEDTQAVRRRRDGAQDVGDVFGDLEDVVEVRQT